MLGHLKKSWAWKSSASNFKAKLEFLPKKCLAVPNSKDESCLVSPFPNIYNLTLTWSFKVIKSNIIVMTNHFSGGRHGRLWWKTSWILSFRRVSHSHEIWTWVSQIFYWMAVLFVLMQVFSNLKLLFSSRDAYMYPWEKGSRSPRWRLEVNKKLMSQKRAFSRFSWTWRIARLLSKNR